MHLFLPNPIQQTKKLSRVQPYPIIPIHFQQISKEKNFGINMMCTLDGKASPVIIDISNLNQSELITIDNDKILNFSMVAFFPLFEWFECVGDTGHIASNITYHWYLVFVYFKVKHDTTKITTTTITTTAGNNMTVEQFCKPKIPISLHFLPST